MWQIKEYGDNVIPEEAIVDIPELEEGEVLIKVEGTTINPSDRICTTGHYFPAPLPRIIGLEGTGRVIKGKG